LLSSVRHHLRALYDHLIAPVRARTEGKSLLIVPHGILHHVPFQALYDGSKHLIESSEIVYGASAAVLRLCRGRPLATVGRDLVMAVPDASAPAVAEEARALGALLPSADVFLGEAATAEILARCGASARRVHIAAHGMFRADNPLFSSLRLGDQWLNLVDVFGLELGGELTTLSACETGLGAVDGGQDMLGLSQGFLQAGSPSLVVSLWRVDDHSTTLFMQRFYEGLLRGERKAEALRQAGLRVKDEYPHPYFWSPFILMGRS
jgi:CHAT domain-containing protein